MGWLDARPGLPRSRCLTFRDTAITVEVELTPEAMGRALLGLRAQIRHLDERISTVADLLQSIHRELRTQREAVTWRERQQLRAYDNRDAFAGED